MKFNELTITKNKRAKRVGRGIAAGQGKTAGRGTKGQMARTGSSKRPGFEGGQNPLMQRMPKLPGFRSLATKMEVIYTGQLEAFGGKVVDAVVLAEAGLISNAFVRVKVITRGELTKKVTLKAQGASASALAAIESAGGSFQKVEQLARPTSAKKTEKAAAVKATKEEKKAKKAASK